MKNKRGSHVGVMLSFVVFITFLIFLYIIIQPVIVTQKDKRPVLEALEIKIIERVSINLETMTISNLSVTGSCIELRDTSSWMSSSNISIKDQFNTDLQYQKGSNFLIINSNKDFFKIYASDEFIDKSQTISGCQQFLSGEYSIGLIKTDKILYENLTMNLTNEYQNDYESLKNILNVPKGSEFSFKFITQKGIVIGPSEKEVSTSIYSKRTTIKYIDDNGNILLGTLNIKVW